MSRGAVTGAGPTNWSQVIHADLKPMNGKGETARVSDMCNIIYSWLHTSF